MPTRQNYHTALEMAIIVIMAFLLHGMTAAHLDSDPGCIDLCNSDLAPFLKAALTSNEDFAAASVIGVITDSHCAQEIIVHSVGNDRAVTMTQASHVDKNQVMMNLKYPSFHN